MAATIIFPNDKVVMIIIWVVIIGIRTIINYIFRKTWWSIEELEDTKREIRIRKSKKKPWQWPKPKVQKDKQRSTKHTYKTKDRVTIDRDKTISFWTRKDYAQYDILFTFSFGSCTIVYHITSTKSVLTSVII